MYAHKMQFKKDKRRSLHLGNQNEKHVYWMGNTLLRSNICELDFGIQADCNLNISSQYDSGGGELMQSLGVSTEP